MVREAALKVRMVLKGARSKARLVQAGGVQALVLVQVSRRRDR